MKNIIASIIIIQLFFYTNSFANTNKILMLHINNYEQCDSSYIFKVLIENGYSKSFFYQITIDGTDGSTIKNKFSSANPSYSLSLKFNVEYMICIYSNYHLVYKFKLANNLNKNYIEKKILLREVYNPDLFLDKDTINNFINFDKN